MGFGVVYEKTNSELAIYCTASHRSRCYTDLEDKNDQVKDCDWDKLQKQVELYPIPSACAVGALIPNGSH